MLMRLRVYSSNKKLFMNMHRKIFYTLAIIVSGLTFGVSQDKKIIVPKDSLYNANIKKSTLYGIYIPRNTQDALSKLIELTDDEARKKLLTIDENLMAKKLYFGLGRWMEYNWNFAEGSRFSHFLRTKGLTYPEDMTRFMLITFHRYIRNAALDSDALILTISNERTQKIKKEQDKMPIISTETKPITDK